MLLVTVTLWAWVSLTTGPCATALGVVHNCPCELQDGQRTVTLRLLNQLVTPYFNLSKTLTTGYKYLHGIMEQAAEGDPRFRFEVKYYGGRLGYIVTEYNDLRADYSVDGRFIGILDEDWKPTEAINNCIPMEGQIITFEFRSNDNPVHPMP